MSSSSIQKKMCLPWCLFLVVACHGFSVFPFTTLATTRRHTPRSSLMGRDITNREQHQQQQLKKTSLCAATSPAVVQGLVQDFDRLEITHNTIKNLRQDIPLLLYRPYTDETAEQCFTRETQLVVGGKEDDYVLASSREEMITLQNALLIAVQGPLRATNLLSRQNLTAPVINCRFVILDDATPQNLSRLVVEWDLKTDISNANISGISELTLQDGKVSKHGLKKVKWNGKSQDAEAVGNALSRIRQTVRSFQQAQTFQSTMVPFGSMFSQYRNDLIRQLDIVMPKQDTTAPLIVMAAANGSDDVTSTLTIDQYNNKSLVALPGTPEWETYAKSHVAMERFVTEIIPKLALAPSDAPFDLQGLFLPNAQMIGLDGTVLLSTNARLAKFYQSLASWRRRALTTWTLVEARAVVVANEPTNKPVVEISFVIDLPGSEASLAGVDRYTLVLEDSDDDDANGVSPRILIESVHQESMSIGGNSKQQDLVLFMRGLVTAVENDRFVTADELWITNLWKRLGASGGSSGSETTGSEAKDAKPVLAPTRSDAAAATIYRIMMALHSDGRDLVDTTIVRNSPPAIDFMIENMQFRGLINEVLLRGRSSYQQNLGLSIGSLRSALRSKRILSEKTPSTKVELTSKGNIRYSLRLFLNIEAFTGLPNLLNIPSAGLPLQVDLTSEYILDPDSGRIVQHRVIESRINGQLTPGDVFSRVLLRGQEGLSLDDTSIPRALTDLLGRLTNNRPPR